MCRNDNQDSEDITDVKDTLAWHELVHNNTAEDIRDAVDILESYAR